MKSGNIVPEFEYIGWGEMQTSNVSKSKGDMGGWGKGTQRKIPTFPDYLSYIYE